MHLSASRDQEVLGRRGADVEAMDDDGNTAKVYMNRSSSFLYEVYAKLDNRVTVKFIWSNQPP